jgi:hypothetical protein
MARNRVIYQSEALYVSDGVDSYETGTHHQLTRIQSANLSYDLGASRTDVNQFGELARISSVVTDTPSVTMDLTYYLTNGLNEKNLGFFVRNDEWGNLNDASYSGSNKQFPSGQLQDVSGQNFYMLTSAEGDDINTYSDADYPADSSLWTNSATNKDNISYIGIGNAFLSDYTLDAAVGDFPTVSVSIEGLNANAGSNAYTIGSVYGVTQNFSSNNVAPNNYYITAAPYEMIKDGNAGGSIDNNPFSSLSPSTTFMTGISQILLPSINADDGTKFRINTYETSGVRGITGRGDLFIDGIVLPRPISSITTGDVEGDNSIDVLRPGDVVLDLGLFDKENNPGDGPFVRVSGSDGVCVQNLSLSIPLSRTPIQCLGTKFAKSRSVDFPVTATLTVSALVNEATSGNLVDTLDANGEHDITISFRDPVAADGTNAVTYTIKNAKFDGEAYTSSIGPNKTVDLTFTTQIGGVNDTTNGVQMSGSW